MDAAGPSLDFYVSDSMQDMLDVDIRAEIASTLATSSDLTSLDHALETISAINNNTSSGSSLPLTYNTNANFLASSTLHASPTAKWMGSSANFWSNTDYYADLGACVNPISVMPLINSASCSASSMLGSPRRGKSATATQSRAVPASPCADRDQHKSHLTFSPAQMKVSAGSLRREQVMAHIPKQISVVTGTGSTAPGTMATNSVLQRRNSSAVDAVRKDLGTELRKAQSSPSEEGGQKSKTSSTLLTTGGVSTNTIKLAPGIGGLTFANSAAYQKLKNQSSVKSSNGSSPNTGNGMVLKREEAAKRGLLQQGSTTPKSIASSAHSPHHQMQSLGSPSSVSSMASSPLSNGSNLVNIANNSSGSAGLVKPLQQKVKLPVVGNAFPKPAYSYSCLIALALKNSRAGSLPVSEIYSFLCQHFPYFENAPSGWKNSVRHNLSLNKCFEKIERPATNGNQRKGCRWAMNPDRITKMDEEVQKWSRKDPLAIRGAMIYPEHLELLERGEMKHGFADSDVELDSTSEIEESSDLEEHDFEDTLVDAMLVEEDEDVVDEDEDDDILSEFDAEDEPLASHPSASQSNHHLPLDHALLAQKSSDFDIEVSLERHLVEKSSKLYEKVDELYDSIDIEDDKEAVHRVIASGQGSHIIELNPADLNANHNGYHHQQQQQQQAKRARLDINYAIGPAGELEQQYGQKVKVQQLMQSQPQPPTYSRRKMPLVNRII
ncbi:blast:Forkhead box protein N4 [Drosophila guanche]|uniref:Blast:Forkhead box protein N4 n=1 Tax=Drosophila guanche TaxID=7266 RepID=A0A3B0KR30_DROGU|nr:blast:Forkhead box protein N4 [Drosophila guanche]